MSAPVETRMVDANGLTFEVDTCGHGTKFALLLHGFPESKHSWRHQMPLLASLGYTVWAPNLRGYGKSGRPEGVENYGIETLKADVAALIDAAAARETLLVAHDWGGLIAWHFAIAGMRPLEALIMLNMPHPGPFFRELKTWGQRRRSWYALFFQIPRVPEWALTRNGAAAVRRAFTDMAVDKSRFPDEVTGPYVENALQPGAMTAMINYYRAAARAGEKVMNPKPGLVKARTLLIWGEADAALGKATTYGTEAYVPDLTVRYLPDVSHWVQQEAPETVNAMIEAFLKREPVPEAASLR